MFNSKFLVLSAMFLVARLSNAQTFTIENSEKIKYPFKQQVKALAFSDDEFHYFSTKMTNNKRVKLGFTSTPQIGAGLAGGLIGTGLAALSMIKKAPDYSIYMQKANRKTLTLGPSFVVEMDVVEGSKKSKNNVQYSEFFDQDKTILVFGTRPNTKENKYQLYAKSVDFDGKELKPWALVLETSTKKVEEGNHFAIERFDDNSFVAYINPSYKKENEKYIRFIVDKDFKVLSEKKAIFPVRDKDNYLYYNFFEGDVLGSICWANGRVFLRKFDFSKPDSIQDDKVYLGDGQKTLFSFSFLWEPEKKSLIMGGGYRDPKSNGYLADGYFITKMNYESMKIDFIELTPFTNGYGKLASGKIMFGSRSDDQFAHFSSNFIRRNKDNSLTFSFQSYMSQYNPRNETYSYGAFGITETKLDDNGKQQWITYLPQKVGSAEWGDVSNFSRTHSSGESEYIYIAREGDLTAKTAKEAGEDGKAIMMYTRVNSKGEKTSKEVFKFKELKEIKKIDPSDFYQVEDNELSFLFYPSNSSLMLGRLLIKY